MASRCRSALPRIPAMPAIPKIFSSLPIVRSIGPSAMDALALRVPRSRRSRDRMQRFLAAEEARDVGGRDAGHGAARLEGRRTDVRREHDVAQGAQTRIDRGLELVDVEACAAEV